ncbi:MAG: NADH:ubiquinone reductase (Na(+)-transporting) subunit B [Bacteroidia bacterium]|jgi:Na+-transporting NADH:ubiquinone oxidoreductase subunit B|nr:NADH:ubiquinone reductase (Na(+)-transporting) subunit B [Bacteroidota bacterium]MCZ2131540.1 NADH:ubiquinone reductase (Na(+)-transporting) subunit B [Bacteroidia bacterium]
MKEFFRKKLDITRPYFQKGGKFEKLRSTYDAFATFMFVPGHTTSSGTHIKDGIDLKRTMMTVIIALIPALLFGMWNVGLQHYRATGEEATFMMQFNYGIMKVLPIIVVSYVVGLGIEFLFAQLRGHDVNEGYLVTGMLIPLIMPPTIPLWMVAVGSAFCVIIGKEVFGGTGMNVLNPALTARAFLFFAYPVSMSGDIWIAGRPDAYSGATVLADLASSTPATYSTWDIFLGTIPGSIGETSTLACLIGAVILGITGIGSWKIMLSVFAGGFFMGTLMNLIPGGNAFMQLPAWEHLIIGGFAFGAIFMATDPVSASQTEQGKIIYGLLIGILTIMIRAWNPAYPEGMMLSILLMNVFAPLIDHYVVEANIKRRLSRVKA